MQRERSKRSLGKAAVYSIWAAVIMLALSIVPRVQATDQPIDLDRNAANGAESKVTTKVLQTYPVTVENTIFNNSAGTSYTFVWPGAGPGGFASYITAGPGVGTKWVWSTVYQVYSIDSPAIFSPTRALPVFGAPSRGVEPAGAGSQGSFAVPGKSIYPSQVTLSDASLTASLITFFSPERTVATCGFQCAPGECELFLENRTGGTATISAEQQDCCPEPHQLICDDGCRSYLTDVQNCGACGNVCAADEICSDGACVCPSGLSQCGTGCIDLQTDPLNCGACGSVCAPDELCSSGACICDPGLTACGAAGCTDLQSDPLNCGACGNVCPSGGFCGNGACVCNPGLTACGGACVDLQNDPLNCGACGNACGANDICTSGTCVTCRSPLQTACGNQCVNIHTDPNNCGGCGNACDFSGCPSAGQGTCSQGSSCVCAPALTSSSLSKKIRFKPVHRRSAGRLEVGVTRRTAKFSGTAAGQARTLADPLVAQPAEPVRAVTSAMAVQNVTEAPVCELAPIVQVLPDGGTYTQAQTGGRFGKEIQTTVSIAVDGTTIAQGPCPQVVPVTGVDTSGVILSPSLVATRDASGDGLCQPGETRCDFFITVADLGDTPCMTPVATLSSPPDQFNGNEIGFLNATSAYPSLPAYPGDGLPLEKRTNATAFSIAPPPGQAPDVGRPFLMSVTCANRPAPELMPITLGFGSVCDPASIDGKSYDHLDGFQGPVSAALVAAGGPVNYSSRTFNHGSTIPFKLTLACGSRTLTDADIEPNPQVVALVHETLGPQSLLGINGDNSANPDDPGFSCSASSCDYQFRTEQLPIGRFIISVQMPDTRVFQAGFTLNP